MGLLSAHYLIGFLLLFNTSFITLFWYVDQKKKRVIEKYPFISIMIPVYNGQDSIGKAVKSVFDSYDKKNFELFVVNDKSKDNTLEVLKKLQKKYKFKIIDNKVNKGKSLAINDAFKETKGEIVLVLDADSLLNKEAIDDIVARFASNKKIGAVSCRYKPINKGFLESMQEIEYNFITMLQCAENIYSCIGLFGGCLAVRRTAFKEVGLFSLNKLTEDTDLSLKLTRAGWKVEQSFKTIDTMVPGTARSFIKQKIRWCGGYAQCFLTHADIFFKNPIFNTLVITFLIIFLISSSPQVSKIIGINLLTSSYYSFLGRSVPLSALFGIFIYPIISMVYIIPTFNSKNRRYYRLLLVYPFSIIYTPLLGINYAIGAVVGVYKFIRLKETDIGWKAEAN